MLTDKYKNFIKQLAENFQSVVSIDKNYRYNINDLVEFVEGMGCTFKWNQTNNFSNKEKIHLSFDKNNVYNNNKENLKILFHEIWHFISIKIGISINQENSYNPASISIDELAANFFSRIMIMPEKQFISLVINHTRQDGMCNIYSVAKDFGVDYLDVIARGNDLNLWNTRDEK